MRASLPIALALLACTQCRGATVEEIAERTLPGVVEIFAYDATGAFIGQASGFFISPSRIITNQHAVDGAYSADVYTDQAYYDRVTILKANKEMDLAILEVDAEDETPLRMSPDGYLRPGQRVIVIGHPLGLEKTLSDGVISGVRAFGAIQDVQITAPISPGSSGSPVLDEEGRVIGVVYAGIDEGQNLNFAIGIGTLRQFLALEESPTELAVARSYVLWRVVVKWAVRVMIAVFAVALGGGWVLVIAIVGIVRLWHALVWLSKAIYRLVRRPFRRRQAPAPAARQPWRWFRPHRGYVWVRRGVIVGAVLVIAAGCLFSASVKSAANPAEPGESSVAQIEAASTTDAESITVCITRTGSKYHRDGCRYLRKSKIPISLKEAKKHYGPCSVCEPPG